MPEIVDETKGAYPHALKKTLGEVLAHLPANLTKGVHLIVLQDEIGDAAARRQLPDALSQYIPKGRQSEIRLHLGNILRAYRQRLLMRWRPTTRARLIGRALSHALVYHKHGGAQRPGPVIAQEAQGIQLMIFKHWLDAYPFESWMKTFILDRMRRKIEKKTKPAL